MSKEQRDKMSANTEGSFANLNRGGRPKGALNKGTAEIKALAQEHGPAAIAKLAYLMENSGNEAEQRAAAAELLNRGYGKATQMLAGDKDADPIQVEANMTDVAKLLLVKLGETSS